MCDGQTSPRIGRDTPRIALITLCVSSFVLIGVPFLMHSEMTGQLPRGVLPLGILVHLLMTFAVFIWAIMISPSSALRRCDDTDRAIPDSDTQSERSVIASDPWRFGSRSLICAKWLLIVALFFGVILPVLLFASMPILQRYDSTAWGYGFGWFITGLPLALICGVVALALVFKHGIRKARMINHHRCVRCGYSLAQTPASGDGATRCPECGGVWKIV